MSELVNIGQQFTGLPMDSLIGGPLMAAADANAKMAVTQTKFLLDIGFNKADKNLTVQGGSASMSLLEPVMVNLTMERFSAVVQTDGKSAYKSDKFVVPLPLISLIPINSLAVTNVDINFEMEVKSAFEEKNKTQKETSFGTKVEASSRWWQPVSINGSVSYSSNDRSETDSQYTKSNSAKYTVSVKAQQLPLPVGITTIIDVFSKNMAPLEVSVKQSTPDNPPS